MYPQDNQACEWLLESKDKYGWPLQVMATTGKNSKKRDIQIKPIFIVGIPRCGSTLVEKIITSGTKYIPAGEETGILSSSVKQKIIQKQPLDSDLDNFQIQLLEKYRHKGLIQKKNDFTFSD